MASHAPGIASSPASSTEVMVSGPDDVYVERRAQIETVRSSSSARFRTG